jgi:hypothetical protein
LGGGGGGGGIKRLVDARDRTSGTAVLERDLKFGRRGVAKRLLDKQDVTSGTTAVFLGPNIGDFVIGGAIRRPCS